MDIENDLGILKLLSQFRIYSMNQVSLILISMKTQKVRSEMAPIKLKNDDLKYVITSMFLENLKI